ncbi:MAG: DUF2461 domain-containing protein [Cytophagales bacterium]|nr:MAG: DUF2461 domain-containing protein [Cytophagales bacterium]TAF61716.1 MAG: DUF2461 domain-containing protein [Cytophagales bacterium]
MKSLLTFLSDLAHNNTREWMEANKKSYEAEKKSFEKFVAELLPELVRIDPSLAALTPKDCIFRLHRDVRFSKDKSPYKTHFGAVWAEGGRKSVLPCYYLHIEPTKSFFAGGLYMPESAMLKKVREEVDYNSESLLKIIEDKAFKKYYGELDSEIKSSTMPRGYDKTHPQAELLKLKSWTVTHPLSDNDLAPEKLKDIVLEGARLMLPFNKWLNMASQGE